MCSELKFSSVQRVYDTLRDAALTCAQKPAKSTARNQQLKSGKKERLKVNNGCPQMYRWTVWEIRGVSPGKKEKEGYGEKDLQTRKVLSMEWKSEGEMEDDSGESMEPIEEVPVKRLGKSELERLVRGRRKEAGNWFERRGEAYRKERSVIRGKDGVDGWARANTKSDSRVLRCEFLVWGWNWSNPKLWVFACLCLRNSLRPTH